MYQIFMEFDHEIITTVILLWHKEGCFQLQESMCMKYCLTA